MVEFGDSMGGLVVDGSYSGGYPGKGLVSKVRESTFGKWVTANKVLTVVIIVLTLVVITIIALAATGRLDRFMQYTSGAGLRHVSEPTGAVNFTQGGDPRGVRSQDWYDSKMGEGFSNARDTPYFPDVTNRVLRMENREKAAVRALAKINSERRRRAADTVDDTTELEWKPFYEEWKQTHPLDGEDMVSGFEAHLPNSPFDLNNVSAY